MISVVVPIYKVEKYIRQCIDSIINQTYKDLEIILVDDGSPDRCPQICDYYATIDSRIKVIHKENGGLSSARNAGIKVAKGEWIAFIDSDDYISNQFFFEMMHLQQTTQAQIVACDFCSFEDDKEPVFDKNLTNEVVQYNSVEAVKAMFYRNGIGWTAWNKLYNTNLFSNIRFPEGMYCEDSATLYKLYLEAEKITYTKQQLYYYRVRQGSIMTTKPIKFYYDSLIINEELCLNLKSVNGVLYQYARGYAGKCATMCYMSTIDKKDMTVVNKEALLQVRKYYKSVKEVPFLNLPEKIFILCCGCFIKDKDVSNIIRLMSKLYKKIR